MILIEPVNLNKADLSAYKKHLADAVIVTHDNRLLLQYRPLNWGSNPGGMNIFGGHVDPGETIMQALRRELNEELGAVVREEDVVFISALTEECTGHTELVHVHFWHDKERTITGCYEAEAREYDTLEQALAAPKLMDYAVWSLKKCHALGLLDMLKKNPQPGMTNRP